MLSLSNFYTTLCSDLNYLLDSLLCEYGEMVLVTRLRNILGKGGCGDYSGLLLPSYRYSDPYDFYDDLSLDNLFDESYGIFMDTFIIGEVENILEVIDFKSFVYGEFRGYFGDME